MFSGSNPFPTSFFRESMNKKKIIIIHSKVSYGFVGLNTTALVLQLNGFEVITIPTVLYSNHLGLATVGGGAVPNDLFCDLLEGVLKLDFLNDVSAVVTGYIGSETQVKMTADFVQKIKKSNPEITYLCDPVMGDIDAGLYVNPAVSTSIEKLLLPIADISTPNQFEIQKILNSNTKSADEILNLIRSNSIFSNQKIIITGAKFKTTLDRTLDNCIVENGEMTIIRNKEIPIQMAGTGELFAAHLLSFLLKGIQLSKAVLLSGDILSHVLENVFNSDRKDFNSEDILVSLNILNPNSSSK